MTNSNASILMRWYDAVNTADLEQLERLAGEIFSPDFVEHDPGIPDFVPGPEGVKKFLREVRKENTGIHVTVHDIFSSGDKAAYRLTLSMTRIATGEPVSAQLIAITRFAGGKIVEEWELSARGSW